jgi:hypothetical protein
MTRRAWTILGICGALLLGLSAAVWFQEPRHSGRKLSQWLLLYDKAASTRNGNEQRTEAEAAVRSIGTNALPLVLRWIQYERSPWRGQALAGMRALPAWFNGALHQNRLTRVLESTAGESRAYRARLFFKILGAEATNAIPELTRLVREGPRGRAIPGRALLSLAALGDAGLDPILKLMEDPRVPDRHTVVFALAQMRAEGVDVSRAFPALVRRLEDRDLFVAEYAAETLGLIDADPSLATQALGRILFFYPSPPRQADDPNDNAPASFTYPTARLRAKCLSTLASFGPRGQSELPMVMEALNDHDYPVRNAATNALARIAPGQRATPEE